MKLFFFKSKPLKLDIKFVAILFLIHISIVSNAQTYRWSNPSTAGFPIVGGRYWQTELKGQYDRLPAKAFTKVRSVLWELSENTAGEYISFNTDARDIKIKYTVEKGYQPANSTAILVSGVDLYLKDVHNDWHWVNCKIDFGDTINVHFEHISFPDKIVEFRLYLPSYRKIFQLQIGVPEQASFKFINLDDKKKPIVVYGTSILQGTSASRPGLTWNNILSRKLGKEVINLGFSGNGQLETPLIDLLTEIDASVFVLDCLPNLHDITKFSNEEVANRLVNSVKIIRATHPNTPIILTEHPCGMPGVNLDSAFFTKYERVNAVLRKTFKQLINTGEKHIFILSAKEIGFDYESTVDGTHPTDIGMMKYAHAYEKIIKQILKY